MQEHVSDVSDSRYYNYDAFGRRIQVANGQGTRAANGNVSGNVTSYAIAYDQGNRVTSVADLLGDTVIADCNAILVYLATKYDDRRSWYPQYLRSSRSWTQTLREFCERYGITKRVVPRLRGALLISSATLAFYRSFLHNMRPTSVVTEYDRNSFTAPLILAARRSSGVSSRIPSQ